MSNMQSQIHDGSGNRLLLRETALDTDGALLEMEAVYPANTVQPPYHYHPYQEERFQVLQGKFHTRIAGVERTYQAGEAFTIPANTPHWMHNVASGEARLIWQVRPALNSQAFFETTWGLDADGKMNTNALVGILQLAVVLREYADVFRLSSLPYLLQRLLFGLLAPLGRLLGYKPSYPRYSVGKGM